MTAALLIFITLLLGNGMQNATGASAGLLVIASMEESRADIVEESTQRTIASVKTGPRPHEIRVAPGGRRAYVVAGSTITVVDLTGKVVTNTIDLGTYGAHDVRVSRDGRLLWAACARAETVLEIDAGSGAILKRYSTARPGAWFVEITPDEKKLYTPNLEGKSISVITRATGEVKVLPLDYQAYGIDVTPDGRHVVVSGRGLAVVDTATDTVRTIDTAAPETGRVRITPDGRHAVVAMAKSLSVIDIASGRLVREIPLPAVPKVLTLSGNGRRAYVTNPEAHSATMVDLGEGRVAATLTTGRTPDGIAWAAAR